MRPSQRHGVLPRFLPIAALLFATSLGGPPLWGQSEFIRGDANGDGAVDIGDAITGLGHLFGGGVVTCRDSIDSNDDGGVDVADPIYSLAYQFSGGPPPAAPFPACGDDPTADAVDCAGPVPTCPSTPPTAFRIVDLDLRDPHVFVTTFICLDFTNPTIGGSINELIQDSLTLDSDGDGLLDLSPLLIFRPLDPISLSGELEVAFGDCSSPLSTTSCDLDPLAVTDLTTVTNSASGTCLGAIPGTTSGYSPPLIPASAPCFSSGTFTLPLSLGGILITLSDAEVGGTYVGLPPVTIANGVLRGFISEVEANATILPVTLPIVGGQPLSSLLPGGVGCCSPGDARDVHLGVIGWWMYFNFVADEVPYTGP